jgi:ADP-ribosylglycohydrolase
MAAAHAEALTEGATITSVIETARRFSPTLRPYVDNALQLVSQCKDSEEFTERYYTEQLHFPNESFWTPAGHPDPDWSFGADPLEVCTEALAFFALSKGNAREAIIGSINFGRDCDTIAGISAALCGALNGADSIPAEWIDDVQNATPKPDFTELALQLCQLIKDHASELKRQAVMLERLSRDETD